MKCKRKIFNLENLTNAKSFLKLLRSKLRDIQHMFVISQLQNHNMLRQGHQWSTEEKAMAYDAYVQSKNIPESVMHFLFQM